MHERMHYNIFYQKVKLFNFKAVFMLTFWGFMLIMLCKHSSKNMELCMILPEIIVHFDEDSTVFVYFGLHNYFTSNTTVFRACIFVFFHTIHSTRPLWKRFFQDFHSTVPQPLLEYQNLPITSQRTKWFFSGESPLTISLLGFLLSPPMTIRPVSAASRCTHFRIQVATNRHLWRFAR